MLASALGLGLGKSLVPETQPKPSKGANNVGKKGVVRELQRNVSACDVCRNSYHALGRFFVGWVNRVCAGNSIHYLGLGVSACNSIFYGVVGSATHVDQRPPLYDTGVVCDSPYTTQHEIWKALAANLL